MGTSPGPFAQHLILRRRKPRVVELSTYVGERFASLPEQDPPKADGTAAARLTGEEDDHADLSADAIGARPQASRRAAGSDPVLVGGGYLLLLPRVGPWQMIATWIFAITIVMQLWGISDKLDAIHKYSRYIEGHTSQAASRLFDTLNVNVENTSLDVVVQ